MATMITIADKFFNVRNGIEVPEVGQRVTARFVQVKDFVGVIIPVKIDGLSVGGINDVVAVTGVDGAWSMDLPAGDAMVPSNTPMTITLPDGIQLQGVVPTSGGPYGIADLLQTYYWKIIYPTGAELVIGSGGGGLSDTTPAAVGTAAAGSSSLGSRSDHVHAHGDQAGGTLHADATTSVDGFMSAADKTKLDGMQAGLQFGTRVQRIQHSDLTDAVSGQAQVVNVGAPLPAGAVVFGNQVKLDVQFTGGSNSHVHLDLGGNNPIGLIDHFDVLMESDAGGYLHSPGYQHETLHAEHLTGDYSGEQLVATFTPIGDALSNLTAGDLTITVYFLVA